MFPPQRYATAAVNREIPLAVQLFFMAVHRCTAFFARLFTGVSAIHRRLSVEDRTYAGVPGLPQGISVTVECANHGEDLRDQR